MIIREAERIKKRHEIGKARFSDKMSRHLGRAAT